MVRGKDMVLKRLVSNKEYTEGIAKNVISHFSSRILVPFFLSLFLSHPLSPPLPSSLPSLSSLYNTLISYE